MTHSLPLKQSLFGAVYSGSSASTEPPWTCPGSLEGGDGLPWALMGRIAK
jgi:hypothetical protein